MPLAFTLGQPNDVGRHAILPVAKSLYLIADWIFEAKQREALIRLSKRTGKPVHALLSEAVTDVLVKCATVA